MTTSHTSFEKLARSSGKRIGKFQEHRRYVSKALMIHASIQFGSALSPISARLLCYFFRKDNNNIHRQNQLGTIETCVSTIDISESSEKEEDNGREGAWTFKYPVRYVFLR